MLLRRPTINSNSAMTSNFGSNISNKQLNPLPSSSSPITLPPLENLLPTGSAGTYSLFSEPTKQKNQSTSPPSRKSFHSSLHPGAMEHPAPHPAVQVAGSTGDPLEQVLGLFPCARLRGLPMDSSLEDVLVFFQGLVVLDVVVVHDSYGHGMGEAFVVFANPMDFQMALQRNRTAMGHRFVEVYQGKRLDYYAAIASKFNHHQDETGDDQGYGSQEIQHFQGNVWAAGGGAVPSQQPTRPPLPQKASNPGSSKPPSNSGTQKTGTTKGSVTGPTGNRVGRGAGEGTRSKGGNANRGNARGGGIQVGEHTGYLRMRGLPFTATKPEIFDFFKVYSPIENSITLTYRSDGRATGEGYIAFKTPDDAQNAMALHRNTMGSRYIELFISNKEEHSRALARETNVR